VRRYLPLISRLRRQLPPTGGSHSGKAIEWRSAEGGAPYGKEISMRERLEKLLTVKSILTLVLTGVFAYLSIIGTITAKDFLTIFTIIVGFYFGTQKVKE